MNRRKNISTTNKEIYEKFDRLYFVPEVLLNDVKKLQVQKIINNINRENKLLALEEIGKYILVKKVNKSNSLNYNMYFNSK